MKVKKMPLILFGLLLLCMSFSLGYIVGHGKGETVVQVSSQSQEVDKPIEQPVIEEAVRQPEENDLINLNTADRAALETLPGIGPELADRILAYREENGPFIAKEQIMDVEGIGEVRYEKLEALITIGGTS